MANYLLVRHQVRDFSEWKDGYDAHLPVREEAGFSEKYMLQGADDPNEVTLLFEAEDLKRAKDFTESAELKEVMEKVGVLGKPDFYFLKG